MSFKKYQLRLFPAGYPSYSPAPQLTEKKRNMLSTPHIVLILTVLSPTVSRLLLANISNKERSDQLPAIFKSRTWNLFFNNQRNTVIFTFSSRRSWASVKTKRSHADMLTWWLNGRCGSRSAALSSSGLVVLSAPSRSRHLFIKRSAACWSRDV